ncbi:MAG: hypothetical protein M1838_002240 [Thelocarpon superellum]|nr:MAG: hypothetical protein M1838_002240 [Thelocarpon superellum]
MPGSKAALIIETAVLPNLVSLILHFASVLGPDWTIHTYHGPDNVGLFDAPAIQRLIAQGQMHLSSLPADAVLTSAAGVSHFLTRAWIWEQLAPASHVLVFQSDSVLCANSHQRVEDFLEYDFVGAPIASEYGQGYNGGLSLRRRERMLDVVRTYNWSEHDTFEDQWFFDKLHRLEQQGDDLESSRLPSLDVASKFSTETVWHATPLGLHQPWRWWQGESLETLKAWCPEASLIHRGSRIN